MGKKRGRLKIIFDILNSVKNKGGTIKPTHLLYKSNLSHQMMGEYLKELMGKDFITEEKGGPKGKSKVYVLSQKGYDYLQEYKQVMRFIDSFGLSDES